MRTDADTSLGVFADSAGGAVEIEQADITVAESLAALRRRLEGRVFDLLFVVAGVSLAPQDAIASAISDADFATMMGTNVLGVMRAVETLQDVVAPGGTIAVMSSGQGSVSGNTTGGFEIYRATKAALNQLMRGYAARQHASGSDSSGSGRTLLLMAPGWVRTGLGGSSAPLGVGDSIPPLIDTVDAQRGKSGLQYLDRHGATIPW